MNIDQELRAAADELLEVVERSPIPQMGDRPTYLFELSSELDLRPARRDAGSSRKRWLGALAAVAATILVVVGVVVVADGNSDDVATDLTDVISSPGVDDVVASPDLTDPADEIRLPGVDDVAASPDVTDPAAAPSVIDPVSMYEWSRVSNRDGAFAYTGPGARFMAEVIVGGPGLVAVGVSRVFLDDGDEAWGAVLPVNDHFRHDDAAVWVSDSGVTWSPASHVELAAGGIGDQRMTSVTIGGPGLVAVGSDRARSLSDGVAVWTREQAAVWTSVEGLTWSRVAHDESVFGGAGAGHINSVTVGGPGLVAVGAQSKEVLPADGGPPEPDESDLDAAVWTSVDGITWSRVAHDELVFGGSGPQEMISVTAGGPGLVAVGTDGMNDTADGAVWTSVDGLTWSRVRDDATSLGGADAQHMASVTVGGPGLVAVGFDGVFHEYGQSSPKFMGGAAVWTSVDGITWSRVSDDAATAWTTPGGTTWSQVPDDSEIFVGAGYQQMSSVTAGGPGLVAVGTEKLEGSSEIRSAVWTSVDGITWSRVTDDEDVFRGATLWGSHEYGETCGGTTEVFCDVDKAAEMTSVTTWGPALIAVGHVRCCFAVGGFEAAVWIATPQS
jgi:hypothetical protein